MNSSNFVECVAISKVRRKLFLLGLVKIPILFFIRPRLVSIDAENCVVKIKLRRRTKNHLNSMYFGAMAVGADVAVGIHTFYISELNQYKISLAFKSYSAEFLKRAESDFYFTCEQGIIIHDMIKISKKEGKRMNQHIDVVAKNTSFETVATFKMELSLKVVKS